MKATALTRLAPFRWARRAQGLRRLLGRHVRLQRVGLDLRFVLEPDAAPAPARPSTRHAAPPGLPPPSRADLMWMLDDLAEVLDSHPSARSVFPSLVLVERALGRRRGPALERLPDTVREDALELLDRLDGTGTRHGLALLRARLGGRDTAPQPLPAGPAVQVQEASLTVFMEADREWEQQLQQAAKH